MVDNKPKFNPKWNGIQLVILSGMIACIVALPISQAWFGDDRLSGSIATGGFGTLWLVNIGLNIKDYGYIPYHPALFGMVDRENRPIAYWFSIAIFLLIGFGCIVGGVLIMIYGAGNSEP